MKVHVSRSPWAFVFVLWISFGVTSAGAADPAPAVSMAEVLTTARTSSGQPITLPKSDAEVVVTLLEIQPGAKLPEHMHPFPRYGYMLAGALTVTNDAIGKAQTFKAGDFIIESIGQWHHAQSVGDVPVKLLVIDQVEAGKKTGNVIVKK